MSDAEKQSRGRKIRTGKTRTRKTRTRAAGARGKTSGMDRAGKGRPDETASRRMSTKDGLPAKLPRGADEYTAVLGSGSDPRASYCTCAMLRRAARRVTLAYDEALKPLGLRLTQYSLLASVLRSDGMSITDLAERLAMERTTLTRNLKPLQAAGWLKVSPGPDRRSRAVEITPSGRALVEEAFPRWQEAERELRRTMGREETAELRALLALAMQAVD